MKIQRIVPIVLLCLVPACQNQNQSAGTSGSSANASTPTARGTLALIKLQNDNGAFPGPAKTDHVGITALAGLAMLSANDLAPSTTSPHITSAANFILGNQNKEGYLYHEGDAAGMYGHAFATLFLTQLHATSSDQGLKSKSAEAIWKAVHLIESSQSKEGGWRYNPQPQDADVSVTAAQLKALTAAKQQGFAVQDAVLSRAVSYLKSAQQPDGGFAYTLAAGQESGWPRSAAATAALLYAGAGGGQDNNKAIAYLQKSDRRDADKDFAFYYGNYYFAQALNLGDPEKLRSSAALRAALLAKQDAQSYAWSNPPQAGSSASPDAYATSMALIILYMPTTNLPAFKAH